MADNVNITAGVGTAIATDDVGGVQYQRVKVAHGGDGSATDVSTTSPMPAQLRDSDGTDVALSGKLGALTETAPATDTASSGLNGRLQRVAQRLSSIIALLPTALGAGGGLKVDGSGTALPVSAASLPLPSGAATETTLGTRLTESDFDTKVGSLTETAPVDDTASSGLNGRLQRIAQRITSLIALLPTSLGAQGGLKIEGVASGTAVPVSVASVPSHAVTNAGTFAVQAAGDVAHDAVDSGAPVKIGAQAITALPTAVAAADRTNLIADKFGRQIVSPVTVRDLVGTQTTTISASTTETTIVTAAASVFNDLVMLIVSNTSASTNTRIDFRDTTGGSVLFSLQSLGGQPPVGFALPVPIPQSAVNTNWTAQCATSTTDIRIYAVFAKNK